MTRAIDDTLGKTFEFRDRSQPGWVVSRTVQVVAYDPARGWQIRAVDAGFTAPWIPFDLWRTLLETHVLVTS